MIIPIDLNVPDCELDELKRKVLYGGRMSDIKIVVSSALVESSDNIKKLYAKLEK